MPVANLINKYKADVVTVITYAKYSVYTYLTTLPRYQLHAQVAFDPEGTGPDTHYKVQIMIECEYTI